MWQLETFDENNATSLVSRENTTDMTREQLLDYIGQLEAVISQQRLVIEDYKAALGIKHGI